MIKRDITRKEKNIYIMLALLLTSSETTRSSGRDTVFIDFDDGWIIEVGDILVQALTEHEIKQSFDTLSSRGRCFKKAHANRISEPLSAFSRDGALISEIILVADEKLDDRFVIWQRSLYGIDPVGHVIECRLVGDIVHEDDRL